MTDTLFIIGNGFDLHHGMSTSYSAFREYIKRRPDIWRRLRTLYGDDVEKDMWWYRFEEMLAKVNYQNLMITGNGMALGPTWIDNLLCYNLPVFFGEWIRSIDDNVKPDALLHVEMDAQFFTFNYTMTLEKAYHINNQNIWHIHNSVRDFNDGECIIVGHDSDNRQLVMQLDKYIKQNPDTRFDVADCINQKIEGGAKKVTRRISDNEEVFHARYSQIKHYIAMGFSFNRIDMQYIKKIVDVNPLFSIADWQLYWHSDGELERYHSAMKELGVDISNVVFNKW